MFERPDIIKDPLYVITTVSNPVRYWSRWDLYSDFARMVAASGAVLYTVEIAFGDRAFVVTEANNPQHLQLRTTTELWYKERALNLLVERLPQDWQYVAWIDADVKFVRPDWADETRHLLQHYAVLQMFGHAQDLNVDHEVIATHEGFMHGYLNGRMSGHKAYEQFHPGYAWAMRRDAWNTLGGLLDTAILGAGDRHMATALLAHVERSYPAGLSAGYLDKLQHWQRRAQDLRRNVGYMPGTLLHAWHGAKKHRNYLGRWKVLTRNQYDPNHDLKPDWQGLWQLEQFCDRQIQLRDDIRAYFRSRNEDAI
jgi:hypothetical protein